VESHPSVRVTTVSPGMSESELTDHITDPADVDVNEVIVRPMGRC
jgi:NADP-dependent 3-hydroxy acid dehydrogenase YdfG